MKKTIPIILFILMKSVCFSAVGMTKEEACGFFIWNNQESCKEIAYEHDLFPKQIEACSQYWAKNEIPCLEVTYKFNLKPKQIKACAIFQEKNQIPFLNKMHKLNLSPEKVIVCKELHEENQEFCLNRTVYLTLEQLTACTLFEKNIQNSCLYEASNRNLSSEEIMDCHNGKGMMDPMSCLTGETSLESVIKQIQSIFPFISE